MMGVRAQVESLRSNRMVTILLWDIPLNYSLKSTIAAIYNGSRKLGGVVHVTENKGNHLYYVVNNGAAIKPTKLSKPLCRERYFQIPLIRTFSNR
jgi:hypothetical protein